MIATRELQLAPLANTSALQNGQLLSRIFTDASGHSFRLTFFVTMVDGEAKGRLVSAQAISRSDLGNEAAKVGPLYCLPCAPAPILSSFSALLSPYLQVSPYFSLDFLINSQPTRAPSAK